MHLQQKILLLEQVYHLYDRYAQALDIACRKSCCDCCTRNVTLTTLEARFMIHAFPENQWPGVRERLSVSLDKPRFIPAKTFNQIADLCVSGLEPPDESIDPAWGPCPLLDGRLCPVYAARPFGCRCLVSSTPCPQTGAAQMSEFTATVNTLFFQVIEHIDQDGFSGNLSDAVSFVLSSDTGRPPMNQFPNPTLIANSPLRNLMIPPEHQDRIRPILDRIRALPI